MGAAKQMMQKKDSHLGKLGVAVGDHLDFAAITAHGLAPLPHHEDAAGTKRRLVPGSGHSGVSLLTGSCTKMLQEEKKRSNRHSNTM